MSVYLSLKKEIYIKQLAHMIVEFDGVDQQVGDSGKSAFQVQRQSAGKIPSCLGEVSLC